MTFIQEMSEENQLLRVDIIGEPNCANKEKIRDFDPKSDELQPFQILNIAAVAGHGLSALVMFIYYSQEEDFTLPTTETYLKWNRLNTTSQTCTGAGRRLNTTNNGEFCIAPYTGQVCDDCGIDLGVLIIFFHLLSFFFQGLALATDYTNLTSLCFGDTWLGYQLDKSDDWEGNNFWGEELDQGCLGYKYKVMIEKGKNPLRFFEYSISAAIMLVAIGLLNGVTDINLIASIAVLTSTCQICGLVVEYLDKIELKWILHFNGWFTFLCAYGIIVHAFSKAASAVEGVEPPDFVYVIVLVLFLLYGCFGFVQFIELTCETRLCTFIFCKFCKEDSGSPWCPACRITEEQDVVECNRNILRKKKIKKSKCNPKYKEMVYVTLSLGSKLVLGWLIFTNILINVDQSS